MIETSSPVSMRRLTPDSTRTAAAPRPYCFWMPSIRITTAPDLAPGAAFQAARPNLALRHAAHAAVGRLRSRAAGAAIARALADQLDVVQLDAHVVGHRTVLLP